LAKILIFDNDVITSSLKIGDRQKLKKLAIATQMQNLNSLPLQV